MPTQQALAPPNLSAMRILAVPEVWPPPAVWNPRATASHGGLALPDTGGARAADPAGDATAWPRQFAVLLAETLTGARPERQLLPWLSRRGSVQLRRLLPLLACGDRPRLQRVMMTRPTPDVIEMTMIVAVGPRTRALAVRLERATAAPQPAWREKRAAPPRSSSAKRWLCTDIEAA